MRRTLLAVAVLLASASTTSADPVDDYVRSVMAARKIPGVSIAILRGGALVRAEGYGLASVELGAAATADTVYQSGSVAKQFTAAGILLLAEDGKLTLDDPLSRHFPEGPAAWHRLTVRHLLTHTSGLRDYGADDIDFRRDYTEADLLEVMRKIPLEFDPGTQWSYSNTGYLVLGLLTSRLAGQHWSEFQAERLFRPLGMTTTRMISERDIVRNRAAGYELDDTGEVKNQDWVAPSLNRLADGALYFTVKDLAAWEAALHARTFMKPASFDAWWTPASLGSGLTYPYGFGWSLGDQRGHRLIEHGGSWQGFRAAIARYVDQGLTVVVLANLAQAQPETMAHEIAGLLEPSLRRPDPARAASDPDPARTARLRGVLDAWAGYRADAGMAKGLADTASGSRREAGQRRATGRRLAAMTAFRYVGEDDLSTRPIDLRGERVERIVYCALDSKEARHVYRFHLTGDGRVADFDSEER